VSLASLFDGASLSAQRNYGRRSAVAICRREGDGARFGWRVMRSGAKREVDVVVR